MDRDSQRLNEYFFRNAAFVGHALCDVIMYYINSKTNDQQTSDYKP